MSQPRFSPGTNEAAATETVSGLVAPKGRWALTKDGQALERTFKFKTFNKTWVRGVRGKAFGRSANVVTGLYDCSIATVQVEKPPP